MIQVAGVATFELRQELIQAGEIGHSSLITHDKLHMPTGPENRYLIVARSKQTHIGWLEATASFLSTT